MLPARQIIHEVHASTGLNSLNEFRRQFQTLHQGSPIQAVKLFFYYATTRGDDALSQAMAFWATSGTLYVSLLLDSDLEQSVSLAAVAVLPRFDPQFRFKLARGVAALCEPEAILRALHLAPALGDYSILISWLRALDKHRDSRVRARSAKLLCRLRPNRGNIERHLQSNDGRVRASVLEALWDPTSIRSDADAFQFFRLALNDSHHRVVANALVGLYKLGEHESIHKMFSFSAKKEHLFRAAMAWAMGAVEDSRSIPILEALQRDCSFTVRQRALHSLATLVPRSPDEKAAENDSPLYKAEFVDAR